MRFVEKPEFEALDTFQKCVASIHSDDLRQRLTELEAKVVQEANNYAQKANNEELYTIPANLCDNVHIAEGRVTKDQLKKVYTSQMVSSRKPSRVIYDKILSNTPLGKCPFCGFGHASTLDHYLPKTKFPILSVLPLNLVPCCSDCNKGKNASIATTQEAQGLHPYFDHQHYINDQFDQVKSHLSVQAGIHYQLNKNSWKTAMYQALSKSDWYCSGGFK